MRIFRFDKEIGKPVKGFGNENYILSRILVDESTETLNLVCAHFDSGDSTEYQQVMVNQLFLVVQGEGWVSKDNVERIRISVGQAPFWITGEWHQVGTDTGMVAIILESSALNPIVFMPELKI
ncbi:cupin [Bacillus nitratireducens]|uniref:cupin n=1 Tax=Bacillus nitratireducens TaxID=2026193 RepID=UPI001BADC686|nr:cupin [Bacillus nitratireducens]QUG87082.1 cupin [Bacillus nitratireducens]